MINKRPASVLQKKRNIDKGLSDHRLLAALLDERPFVKAEFINYDKYPFFKDTNNLISELQHIGKSTLYDYEDAGKFSYKSYPDYYL